LLRGALRCGSLPYNAQERTASLSDAISAQAPLNPSNKT